MANTTKNIEHETEAASVASATPVSTSSKSRNNDADEISALKKQNAEMQSQLTALMAMLANMNNGNNTHKNSLLDEVTIVHLVDRAPGLTTHIHLSNLDIDMSAFGEERTLDRRQAEELAGKYRKYFEKGIIAFGAGNEEIASRFALKSIGDYEYMKPNFVRQLASITAAGLEDIYTKLSDGHKSFVLEYFKRKIIEGDPAFSDPYKVETLNRLSGGCMSDMILDRQRKSVVGDDK